jgi:hypothetical protein
MVNTKEYEKVKQVIKEYRKHQLPMKDLKCWVVVKKSTVREIGGGCAVSNHDGEMFVLTEKEIAYSILKNNKGSTMHKCMLNPTSVIEGFEDIKV